MSDALCRSVLFLEPANRIRVPSRRRGAARLSRSDILGVRQIELWRAFDPLLDQLHVACLFAAEAREDHRKDHSHRPVGLRVEPTSKLRGRPPASGSRVMSKSTAMAPPLRYAHPCGRSNRRISSSITGLFDHLARNRVPVEIGPSVSFSMMRTFGFHSSSLRGSLMESNTTSGGRSMRTTLSMTGTPSSTCSASARSATLRRG